MRVLLAARLHVRLIFLSALLNLRRRVLHRRGLEPPPACAAINAPAHLWHASARNFLPMRGTEQELEALIWGDVLLDRASGNAEDARLRAALCFTLWGF